MPQPRPTSPWGSAGQNSRPIVRSNNKRLSTILSPEQMRTSAASPGGLELQIEAILLK